MRSTMIGISLLSCITQDKLKWYYSLRTFSYWFFNKSCITVRKLLRAKYVILPHDLYGPKQALTWKKKLLEGAYSRCKWAGNTLSGFTRWELEGERKKEKDGWSLIQCFLSLVEADAVGEFLYFGFCQVDPENGFSWERNKNPYLYLWWTTIIFRSPVFNYQFYQFLMSTAKIYSRIHQVCQ